MGRRPPGRPWQRNLANIQMDLLGKDAEHKLVSGGVHTPSNWKPVYAQSSFGVSEIMTRDLKGFGGSEDFRNTVFTNNR